MPVIARDSAYLASLTPEQLYGELGLAATRLANSYLAPARDGWPAICHQCGAKHPADLLEIPHAEDCLTGSVVRVLVALGHAEVQQALDRQSHPNPRKESSAAKDAGRERAVAEETRPHLVPFPSARAETPAGVYGEPWGIDESGAVHDAAGNTIAERVGCDLVEPDDLRALVRMVACVNFCRGVHGAQLTRTGGAM